jgi:hypothetical protein
MAAGRDFSEADIEAKPYTEAKLCRFGGTTMF